MAYSCWKINTLTILFVMLFSLFVIPVYAQSQKEVFDISKGRLTQTWPSKDMQKLLPSLSVDSWDSLLWIIYLSMLFNLRDVRIAEEVKVRRVLIVQVLRIMCLKKSQFKIECIFGCSIFARNIC